MDEGLNFIFFVRPPNRKDFEDELALRVEPTSLYLKDPPVMPPPVPLKAAAPSARNKTTPEPDAPNSESPGEAEEGEV